jgi:hypothetical protein
MKLHIISTVLFMGCLSACGGAAGSAARPPAVGSASPRSLALDGRAYDVILETPDAPAQKDTLRFANGQFESTACTTLGFPEWSDYEARADGDSIPFHVLSKHPSGTTMDWHGSVKGDSVEGTANRAMNGKTDVLKFKGSLHL